MAPASGYRGTNGLITAVEQSADAVVITDVDGLIQFVNPAFVTMTGYTREEVLGHNPRVLKSGRQPESLYRELWNTILSGRVWQGNVINRRKDGSDYAEEMQISPVRGTSGEITGFIAIKRDVTEQRAQQEAQRFLAAIVESSEDAIFGFSPAGIILSWNRGAEAIFGYSAASAMGKHVSMLCLPELVARLEEAIPKMLNGSGAFQQEGRALRKDGRKIHVLATTCPVRNPAGDTVAVSIVLRDISLRYEGEQSRALLASIVESSADAIHSIDMEGTILSWNRGSELLFGYSSEEVLGKNVAMLARSDFSVELRKSLSELANGAAVDPVEVFLRGRDDRQLHICLTVSPMRNPAGAVIGASTICRDIAPRLLAEKQLRESEERFRSIFEHAPFGMSTTALDGRFIKVNDALCRMAACSESQLVGTNWRSWMHPGDLEKYLQEKDQFLRGQDKYFETEKRWIDHTGKTVLARLRVSPGEDGGNGPSYFVVHIEDITERRQAQEALVESEERFRIMADGCPAIMWVTNAEGGIQFINRAFKEFAGKTYEEIEGSKWQLLMHADDSEKYVGEFQRAIRAATGFRAIGRARRADGDWRWLESYAEPRLSPDGELLGHVGISLDITERRHVEAELELARERTEGANQRLAEQHVLLEKERKMLRALIDNVPDFMYVKDTESRFVVANVHVASRMGAETPEDLIGKTDSDFFPSAVATAFREDELRVMRTGQPLVSHEETVTDRSGVVTPLLTTKVLVRDREGAVIGIAGVGRDISELKKADALLAKTAERLMLATRASAVGIWDWDIVGNHMVWDDQMLSLYGISRSDFSGAYQTWRTGVHPQDRTRGDAEIQLALSGEKDFDTEFRVVWKNGTIHTVRALALVQRGADGQPVRMIGTNWDITAQTRVEEELRNSEEKFRQLAENVHEVFWMMTPAADEMLYISPAYEQVWERTCDSLYRNPMSWLEPIHPDDREQAHAMFARHMLGESVDSNYRIHTPDGHEKWISDRAFPIRDGDGKVVRIVGVAEEITDRKRYEAELIHAREGAEAANRAKSGFLANMSHEIRTPMNGVIGMLQLLLQSNLDPEQHRYASVAQASGNTLLALINDILDLSKIEAGKVSIEKRDFDLRRTIAKVIELWRIQANTKGLAFSSQVTPQTPTLVRGDCNRLRQILNNIVSNAIKFTSVGGVALDVEVVNAQSGCSTVRFAVTDTGIGIATEKALGLFSPFVQADASTTRKYGGTGLGLAISKQLVELMGGQIGIDSREGEGSTFWFTLVFESASADALTSASSTLGSSTVGSSTWESSAGHTLPPPAAGREGMVIAPNPVALRHDTRILIAEDNLTNRIVTLAQLKKLGYKADTVVNGAEAVAAMEKNGYDIILMDCEMPVMDGYEATQRIRAAHSRVVIIAVTAQAMSGDRDKCIQAGMDEFLPKPVELQRLDEMLAKWRPGPAAGSASEDTSASHSGTDAAVFDSETLLKRLMEDRELAEIVIRAFVQDFPTQLEILRKGLADADVPAARLQAHALKGSSATVSAVSLSAVGKELEQAAGEGDMERFAELLPRTVEEFERFKDALKHTGWL